MPPASQLLRTAGKRGVTSVALQHGDLVCDLSIDLLPPAPDGGGLPDVNCLLGEHYRQLLLAHGQSPPEKIEVTGMPWRQERQLPLRDPDGPVLVVSQTFVSAANEEAFHCRVAQAMAKSKDIAYRVKMHPAQSDRIARGGLYPPETEFAAGQASFRDTARGCSVIVGSNSFALIEGLLASIPVISLQLPAERLAALPELSPLLHRAGQAGELVDLIRQCRARSFESTHCRVDHLVELDPGARRLARVLLDTQRDAVADGP